jgi:hypothetical protein
MMMEKFDGVRVFWDGKGVLFTRNMQTINLPAEILSKLPQYPFEGELWCGYNSKDVAVKKVNSLMTDWQNVKILAFDAPLERSMSYETRLAKLKDRI